MSLRSLRDMAWSGFPAPIGSETSTMPAQQRLRPYDFQRLHYPGSQAIEADKHQAVDAAEGYSLRGLAPQDVQLMPKHKDFGFQRGPRLEQPDQGAPGQPAKIAHRWNYRPIRGRFEFAVGTGMTRTYNKSDRHSRDLRPGRRRATVVIVVPTVGFSPPGRSTSQRSPPLPSRWLRPSLRRHQKLKAKQVRMTLAQAR
jgi:hypothetical protein